MRQGQALRVFRKISTLAFVPPAQVVFSEKTLTRRSTPFAGRYRLMRATSARTINLTAAISRVEVYPNKKRGLPIVEILSKRFCALPLLRLIARVLLAFNRHLGYCRHNATR